MRACSANCPSIGQLPKQQRKLLGQRMRSLYRSIDLSRHSNCLSSNRRPTRAAPSSFITKFYCVSINFSMFKMSSGGADNTGGIPASPAATRDLCSNNWIWALLVHLNLVLVYLILLLHMVCLNLILLLVCPSMDLASIPSCYRWDRCSSPCSNSCFWCNNNGWLMDLLFIIQWVSGIHFLPYF